MRERESVTEADQDSLESLVGAGLKVQERDLVLRTGLGLVAHGLKQQRRSV